MNNDKSNLFTIVMMILISLLFFTMIKWEADASYKFTETQVGSILNEWEIWWTWFIVFEDWVEQAYRDSRYCNSVTGKCFINYKLWNKTYKFPVHWEVFQMHIEENILMSASTEKKDLTPVQTTIFINALLIKKWYKPIYIY